jgi:hypothetical protein
MAQKVRVVAPQPMELTTLMITKSVDWKSDGLEAGSKMEELDWKD